ncbi:MAG TPA: DUF1152 domain-containing protein [Bacteroidetes bacterium]|nr:DUF1152 domain-containing protein [Bacteroidota bacterium]
MSYSINKIPLFQELEKSQNILIAGAGGGFDVFCGIPLYFNLINQGKKVIIGNFSFTKLSETTSEKVFPYCYKIRSGDSDLSGRHYFPERYLKLWFGLQGDNVDVYGFERIGVNPLKDAYKYLIKKHRIDTIILVDGGTDSLMFGDEEGLGTPQEDVCSMAAVYKSGVKNQYLVSIGFGIDHYHGVSHYRFLENVAELSKDGGYLGLFQLTKEMDEAAKYIDAIRFANDRMRGKESIVSSSIVSALEGNYGDCHVINRTKGSELWINPLMTIYWSFDLRKVVKKIKYYDLIKDTNTIAEFNGYLSKYRYELEKYRDKKQMPI